MRESKWSEDHLEEISTISERMRTRCADWHEWDSMECWVDENDPTLMHFKGILKAPVKHVVVKSVVSRLEWKGEDT